MNPFVEQGDDAFFECGQCMWLHPLDFEGGLALWTAHIATFNQAGPWHPKDAERLRRHAFHEAVMRVLHES